MLSEPVFRRIVRASAWYDLAVTAPFATPWSLNWILSCLTQIHYALGLTGDVPPLTLGTTLFANLLGSVVVIWALVRIRSPLPWLGRYDAVARGLFALWQLHAVFEGASTVLVAFAVIEVAWGIAQVLPFRSMARQSECEVVDSR
jgi:hypothetical protein